MYVSIASTVSGFRSRRIGGNEGDVGLGHGFWARGRRRGDNEGDASFVDPWTMTSTLSTVSPARLRRMGSGDGDLHVSASDAKASTVGVIGAAFGFDTSSPQSGSNVTPSQLDRFSSSECVASDGLISSSVSGAGIVGVGGAEVIVGVCDLKDMGVGVGVAASISGGGDKEAEDGRPPDTSPWSLLAFFVQF